MTPSILPQGLTDEEALAFFRAKGFKLLPAYSYKDVWQGQHATGFTVAKMTNVQLLKEVHASLDHAIASGMSFEEWKRRIKPTLKKYNWTGWRLRRDPETGVTRKVELGTDRRLRTIFDVNVRTAHAAGQWARFEANRETRPYLRYVAVLDGRTRPVHARWHGTVLPMGHPAWATHTPPCGWRCRCSLRQLGPDDMERYGFTVAEGWPAPPEGEPAERTYVNDRTGQVSKVPYGVDAAFAYPVGRMPYAQHLARAFNANLIDAPPELAAAAQAESARTVMPALVQDYRRWAEKALNDLEQARKDGTPHHSAGDHYPVGVLSRPVLDRLAKDGLHPVSGVITMEDRMLVHFTRAAKEAAIPRADILRVPDVLAKPEKVYLDKADRALLYVFTPTERPELGKLVVRVDFRAKGRLGDVKGKLVTNAVRTGGLVQPGDLAAARYEEIALS